MGFEPSPKLAPALPDWKKDAGLKVPALSGAVDANAPPIPGIDALAEEAGNEAPKDWEMFAADRGAPNPPPLGPIALLNSAIALECWAMALGCPAMALWNSPIC
jgi:hypothetical protein